MLGDVRERLLHEPVDDRLELRVEAAADVDIEVDVEALDGGQARGEVSIAGARPISSSAAGRSSVISVRRLSISVMYVLNAGPSIWSAFHVIGTVFDRTVIEGAVGHDAQTINLAPSQGGWVEFTLDEEGGYPFVTHAFGDMVKGALGVLHTPHAPHAGEGH